MVTLYVEGGGRATALKTDCRKGFRTFLRRAGIKNEPRIVACGTRRQAYERFCLAIAAGDNACLLIDSEAPIATEHQTGPPRVWQPWRHLKVRPGDGWTKPVGAEEKHCHLMVQCMEHWFLADRAALAAFFGQGFASNALPKHPNVESVPKRAVFDGLAKATKACKTKLPYNKGAHSFEVLNLVDPALVAAASPWAKRFLDEMHGIP